MPALKGHTSPETAYVVDDYPYGFRLRCKIRYWLEYHPTRGTRFFSQTTNPKRPGEPWNKPKASTYAYVAGCMILDEQEHVTWSGLTEYASLEECREWLEAHREGLTPEVQERVNWWIRRKQAYEDSKKGQEQKP